MLRNMYFLSLLKAKRIVEAEQLSLEIQDTVAHVRYDSSLGTERIVVLTSCIFVSGRDMQAV